MKLPALAALLVAAMLAGACAGLGLGPSSSAPLHVEVPAMAASRPLLRAGQPLRARVAAFSDARRTAPRHVGKLNATMRDMHGTELQLDRDVADLVTETSRARLAADGMQLVGADATADLVVEGVVRDFALDVAGRDERRIGIEVTLRDGRSGKPLWAGAIVDRHDRYAGVAGNSRATIVAYLEEGVANYATKLAGALREALPKIYLDAVESAPPPTHTAVAGVTTLQAPVPQPVVTPASAPVPPAAATKTTDAAVGYFAVQTVPPRVRVYIGDVYYGMSPLRLELPAGIASVSFKLNGYRPAAEKVSIRPGETTELELTLDKQ